MTAAVNTAFSEPRPFQREEGGIVSVGETREFRFASSAKGIRNLILLAQLGEPARLTRPAFAGGVGNLAVAGPTSTVAGPSGSAGMRPRGRDVVREQVRRVLHRSDLSGRQAEDVQ
jgi:hypothetical protein